ncbi:MAG: hypothetical protein GYA30_07105 [Chloroflexi bacterium]|nr:hypothetical protein [Chloroflexota bacterium]OQA92725.1 MAG: hypothetical protein BWY25_03174 [Chloroflexi bacterium ADurb.Bin222]HOC22108.1 hypothetical protein [Anaerolineae bacterium]HQJ12587.1 hypothetical protein [Anaerolineae bacterium]HQM15016.1 hypothetical protein [Anaerolineae bacterium]
MTETTRVTLVLPTALWEELKRLAPPGERSRFAAEALEAEIRRQRRREQLLQIQQLQKTLFEKYGEMPAGAEELHQLREERDAQLLDPLP